jgi:EAL domain-containing protein (putative c-di-GMP-specific phosphodiesterase class I)
MLGRTGDLRAILVRAAAAGEQAPAGKQADPREWDARVEDGGPTFAAREHRSGDARRHVAEPPSRRLSAMSSNISYPAAPTADPARERAQLDKIIAQRTVRTLFQPVIQLSSGAVVGFEAVSRGPAGTALESPAALLDAAVRAGRLGELDWVFRVQAMEQAARSRLHPSLSWFINVEPAGLATECPDHLLRPYQQARSDLRVILEVVERDDEGYVHQLLEASQQARYDAWGVALDHVGTDDRSLALLPLLLPDVVKLDLSVVHERPTRQTAAVTAAVRAYAERRRAVIVAEGIETSEHAQRATVFGATYGQGYLYGKPGALPESVPPPRDPIPLRQRPEPIEEGTPFEVLARTHEPRITAKDMLLHICDHLEDDAAHQRGCLVLSCFQHARFFSPAKRSKYARLAAQNAYTSVLAGGAEPIREPRYDVAPIAPASHLVREWDLIVLNANYAAAFVARDLGDSGPDLERRFEFVYTHDRIAVVRAATAFIEQGYQSQRA